MLATSIARPSKVTVTVTSTAAFCPLATDDVPARDETQPPDWKETTITAFGLPVAPKLSGRPRVGQARLPEGRVGSVTHDVTHSQ